MAADASRVELGDRAYDIIVGRGLFGSVAEFPVSSVAVVSNETIFVLYGEQLLAVLNAAGKRSTVIILPDGEAHKNMESLERILNELVAANMGRDGGIIALGGGVIGDLAGFAAAVYMRGIAVMQMPTTLLAQVDAAIGGKTGVNHPQGKNLIGAFHQPTSVLCDIDVLESLPAREYHAGLAEAVKYGMLGDADYFAWLEANRAAVMQREPAVLEQLVRVAAHGKAAIVGEDERERDGGRRALLNLGHTFAHAVETVAGYGVWLHGEAVAMGLAAAARLSEKNEGFAAADTARVCDLLRYFSLPMGFPSELGTEDLLAAMALDKKNRDGDKRFIVMERLGAAKTAAVADTLIKSVLDEMR